MNTLKLPITLTFLLILFVACSTDDEDNSREIYTTEDLNVLHNNSSKTWELEAYYQNYDNWISDQNECFVDDSYIFKTDNEVDVISGNENCYYGDSEIAEASYTFYEEQGEVWLTMIRGKITDNIVSSTSFSLKLIELQEDRMVFSSGHKGDYKMALIFVKN
ncbi:hypothetical protein [Winogradskyella thalassocola]|uniref:Lipocalin-like domain-containing protein n=1 Tax=Winogradskyella thalassocola TaxID=262004 RepID=A0A1G8LY76_9FLAO|nr:hypothetical protein [Winogradskyella thalassocola]SDI60605.1 hypothetical protein SAMN04489796_11423 [Winogradskyella thalassocola]